MLLTMAFFHLSFLCLVPDEAKSSYHVEGTGYDTYLRDAHRQVSPVTNFLKWNLLLHAYTFYIGRFEEIVSISSQFVWLVL